jgi:FMN phosphatase YigB (HAD superfamily)
MEKKIILDYDGTIADWNSGFNIFMESKGFPQLVDTDHHYNISSRHGVPVSQAMAYVKEFNESRHIEDIMPFADSVEYLEKLASKGFRFTVVTSISSNPKAKEHRLINASRLFGDIFDDIICLEIGSYKKSALEKWQNTGYFWIEDHIHNAEAGYELGMKTILINHPYNSHYTSSAFPVVSYNEPWKEIYSIISAEYKLEE